MIRLFVGLTLPEEVRMRLTILASGIPGARWVPEENLHITLRFIGEVDEAQADSLHEALEGIRAPGFDVELAGVGTFGRGKSPHTLWVGVAPNPPLLHLQGKIESALVREGLEPEGRKFVPHMTIARLKDPRAISLQEFIAGHNLLRLGWRADSFTLFSSRLGHGDPVYIAEADYPLMVG